MKKRLIAVAALALVSGMAAAQSSVTIYGNVDLGLLTQNHAPAGASSTSLANGGISPSIWGFRGTEDLGDGLKANFNLEGHINADTGVSPGGPVSNSGALFRRQANVGLSGGFGTVTLGNQYSPAILAFAATDPRGLRENFSGLYSWAFNSGALSGGGINTNNDVGVFLQNAISYSNTVGPVGIAAAYSLSEGPGNLANTGNHGAVYSLGVTYSGPVSLSAAYQQANKPGTSDSLSKIYTVGAGYTMGAFTGKLNYLRGVNKNVTTLVEETKVGVIGAGVDWKTAANNTAMASVYFGKDKNHSDDKTTTFILSDEYALSKRTTLYGQLAFANAKAGSTALTSVILSPTLPDTNTSLLNVGIKHSF
jgi:predicted porin